MRRPALLVVALVQLLLVGSTAHAWHISGKVYCDLDNDGHLDIPGDAPIASVTVDATSQSVNPGQIFTALTSGSGSYNTAVLDVPNTYKVSVSGLPAGQTVVVPSGGVQTVVLTNAVTSAGNVDFLVQGCAGSTTSTTHASTTTTTGAPTTSSTTATSTSTTTTTTAALACDCAGFAFLVGSEGKFNNDATLAGNVAANDPTGRVRTGKNVRMPDGAVMAANTVQLGNAASVFDVRANTLLQGSNVEIRGTTGPAPALPLFQPFCAIPAFTCGGQVVRVQDGETAAPLAPGVYGALRVLDGGTLPLQPGTFTFCDVKLGRGSAVTPLGPTTINVAGQFVVGSGSQLNPVASAPPVVVNVSGKFVRLSQGAVARAAISAPNAKTTFGRDSNLLGCFCSGHAKTDKHIDLQCVEH